MIILANFHCRQNRAKSLLLNETLTLFKRRHQGAIGFPRAADDCRNYPTLKLELQNLRGINVYDYFLVHKTKLHGFRSAVYPSQSAVRLLPVAANTTACLWAFFAPWRPADGWRTGAEFERCLQEELVPSCVVSVPSTNSIVIIAIQKYLFSGGRKLRQSLLKHMVFRKPCGLLIFLTVIRKKAFIIASGGYSSGCPRRHCAGGSNRFIIRNHCTSHRVSPLARRRRVMAQPPCRMAFLTLKPSAARRLLFFVSSCK